MLARGGALGLILAAAAIFGLHWPLESKVAGIRRLARSGHSR
jgi:hypothetical protein